MLSRVCPRVLRLPLSAASLTCLGRRASCSSCGRVPVSVSMDEGGLHSLLPLLPGEKEGAAAGSAEISGGNFGDADADAEGVQD